MSLPLQRRQATHNSWRLGGMTNSSRRLLSFSSRVCSLGASSNAPGSTSVILFWRRSLRGGLRINRSDAQRHRIEPTGKEAPWRFETLCCESS